mgnify:CR=1 FL=1
MNIYIYFFNRSDNNQDVFVHRSGIQANNGMSGLDDGEPVEFNLFNGIFYFFIY